ncbi:hypothetical protein HMPREF9581_00800 [Cutibacterium acnes HL087PA3]|nr:hypothetical protein HMPREF9567_00269 [Cutibacterium acnes HL013PA1]EFS80910.1 hypothetical protein HMPREF9598_02410 [Cutibacterium acnes HL050PA1]EFS85186.1 hypothetical protein HMPREF9600_00484 [Cutibacterium acnes HL050PA3]EFS95153.1 hypothetical protein HMPREF9608_01446 [Cutibacterium acnes HL067PA1]EGF01279.1 hypothetical protein HMPREF9581_00800 [Cutibacterium acnes HL087PA3]
MVDHIQGTMRFPRGGVVTMIEKKILCLLWHWYCDVSAGCQQTSAVAA